MTIEQAKQELVRRYKYLYENTYFILAPYMYEQTEEEYQKSVDDYIKQFGRSIIDKPSIYLKINRLDSVNSIFEEFLLSDKKLEDTELYTVIINDSYVNAGTYTFTVELNNINYNINRYGAVPKWL